MKIYLKKWLPIPMAILIFSSGYLAALFPRQKANISYDNPNLRENNHKYKFINPLLACDTTQEKQLNEFKPLEIDINKVIDSETQTNSAKVISVYFKDLSNGRWVAVNEGEKYFPASLLKVPLMIAYFKLSESDPKVLSKLITYRGQFDDNAKEDMEPQRALEIGKSYAIEDLIYHMIVYSDNNAAHLLYDNISRNSLNEEYSNLGIDPPQIGRNLDSITVRSYSYFFRILYNATYLNREMSENALGLLVIPDFPGGIRGGLPAGVATAQKFGESEIYTDDGKLQSRELHDCGIVYHPKTPYLICIMTKGDDFEKLSQSIKDVSKLVYEKVSGFGY